MYNNFIFVYLIFHLAYPTLCKESFIVIWIMFSFTNFEAINTISASNFFWFCFCAFTITLLASFLLFFFLGIGSSCSVMLTYFKFLSKLTNWPHFIFPLEWVSLYLCCRWTAYLLDYSWINLQSSEECLGPFIKHVLVAMVIFLLGETTFFVLWFPAWPFMGLVGDTASPFFLFMKWLSWLESALMIFLESVSPFYTC